MAVGFKRFISRLRFTRIWRYRVFNIALIGMLALGVVYTVFLWIRKASVVEAATEIQTVWTVLGVVLGLFGIREILQRGISFPDPIMEFNSKSVLHVEAPSFPLTLKGVEVLVYNGGRSPIRIHEVFWQLYPPRGIAVDKIIPLNGYVPVRDVTSNSDYPLKLSGQYPATINPGRSFKLFALNVIISEPGEYKFLYFSSSEFGYHPDNLILNVGDEEMYANMPCISIVAGVAGDSSLAL